MSIAVIAMRVSKTKKNIKLVLFVILNVGKTYTTRDFVCEQ